VSASRVPALLMWVLGGGSRPLTTGQGSKCGAWPPHRQHFVDHRRASAYTGCRMIAPRARRRAGGLSSFSPPASAATATSARSSWRSWRATAMSWSPSTTPTTLEKSSFLADAPRPPPSRSPPTGGRRFDHRQGGHGPRGGHPVRPRPTCRRQRQAQPRRRQSAAPGRAAGRRSTFPAQACSATPSAGPPPPRQCMVCAQRTYVRAFFDLHLRGIDSRLFAGPSPRYPEIQVRPVTGMCCERPPSGSDAEAAGRHPAPTPSAMTRPSVVAAPPARRVARRRFVEEKVPRGAPKPWSNALSAPHGAFPATPVTRPATL
jgi:hypothetical protein